MSLWSMHKNAVPRKATAALRALVSIESSHVGAQATLAVIGMLAVYMKSRSDYSSGDSYSSGGGGGGGLIGIVAGSADWLRSKVSGNLIWPSSCQVLAMLCVVHCLWRCALDQLGECAISKAKCRNSALGVSYVNASCRSIYNCAAESWLKVCFATCKLQSKHSSVRPCFNACVCLWSGRGRQNHSYLQPLGGDGD